MRQVRRSGSRVQVFRRFQALLLMIDCFAWTRRGIRTGIMVRCLCDWGLMIAFRGQGLARPDLVLRDLVSMLYPGFNPGYTTTFLRNINSNETIANRRNVSTCPAVNNATSYQCSVVHSSFVRD